MVVLQVPGGDRRDPLLVIGRVSGATLGHGEDHDADASLAKPTDTLLVVTHGGLSSKESVLALCWEARRRGVDCLAVDALGHGGSSPQPPVREVETMARALVTHPALGVRYQRVRFVGHSMGAYLGRGRAYPCHVSFALGQTTLCDDDRVVWGTLHRTLGLSDDWYLLAHVLESWTPWVVRKALDRLLQPAPPTSPLGLQIALAWSSFAVAAAIGVLAARLWRGWSRVPPLARGLGGALWVWSGLTIGAWRALWCLLPSQRSDWFLLAFTVALALACTVLARAFRSASARDGVALGTLCALLVATALYLLHQGREMGGLMLLLPTMSLPLLPWVWLWERLSRRSARTQDAPFNAGALSSASAESAAFTAALLALFVALLLPDFRA